MSEKIKRFAFIGYPLSWDLWYKFNPEFKKYSEIQAKAMMTQTPPFIASNIRGVQSINGEQIVGDFILTPLLPEQILELDPTFVIDRIVEAGKLAEAKGAKIVGLGGLTSVIGNQGELVAKRLNIAVTTGNTYTAAMTAEATFKAAELMQVDLARAKVAVIGATGSIGTVCSHLFAEKCREMRIVARNPKRLKSFGALLSDSYKAKTKAFTNIDEAVNDTDIIIAATNSPTILIDVKDLKSGCIVCDVATPRNVSYSSSKSRNDVLVIDGGLIKPPGEMKIDFDIGLPPGIAYACLSETMILTFENRFENYTMGSGISMDKVKEITALGKKHGFSLSEFQSFGHTVTKQDIEELKQRIKHK
jgi:fatty aldehyde-generating acyl-ACP reductase